MAKIKSLRLLEKKSIKNEHAITIRHGQPEFEAYCNKHGEETPPWNVGVEASAYPRSY